MCKKPARVSIPASGSVLRYLQLGIAFQANFKAFSAAGQQRHALPCLVNSDLHLSMAINIVLLRPCMHEPCKSYVKLEAGAHL